VILWGVKRRKKKRYLLLNKSCFEKCEATITLRAEIEYKSAELVFQKTTKLYFPTFSARVSIVHWLTATHQTPQIRKRVGQYVFTRGDNGLFRNA
jgi:hypothetical protein